MVIMVSSLLWVTQDLNHQPYIACQLCQGIISAGSCENRGLYKKITRLQEDNSQHHGAKSPNSKQLLRTHTQANTPKILRLTTPDSPYSPIPHFPANRNDSRGSTPMPLFDDPDAKYTSAQVKQGGCHCICRMDRRMPRK